MIKKGEEGRREKREKFREFRRRIDLSPVKVPTLKRLIGLPAQIYVRIRRSHVASSSSALIVFRTNWTRSTRLPDKKKKEEDGVRWRGKKKKKTATHIDASCCVADATGSRPIAFTDRCAFYTGSGWPLPREWPQFSICERCVNTGRWILTDKWVDVRIGYHLLNNEVVTFRKCTDSRKHSNACRKTFSSSYYRTSMTYCTNIVRLLSMKFSNSFRSSLYGV